MNFVELLKDRLRGVDWKESCEAGAPVPESEGCHHVDCTSVRLTTLRPGEQVAVSCLEEPWTAESAKLAGLGILPGVRLRVVQRRPAWVVKVGRSQLALDSALASRIRVVQPGAGRRSTGPALPIVANEPETTTD
jgi:Fe2+ transport system protein FeoA